MKSRRIRQLLGRSPELKKKYKATVRLWRSRLVGLAILASLVFLSHKESFETVGEEILPKVQSKFRNLASEGRTECSGSLALVAPYLLILLYAFLGVAIVCDEYFETALEVISERLSLSDDVAGATFMAAGSSAPELFTAMLDAFGPSNSIGVGTIVGSAMFNILIIIGLSALVTKGNVHLDWRPIARDVIFYALSIVALLVFSAGGPTFCGLTSNETVKTYMLQTEVDLVYPANSYENTSLTIECHYGEVGWWQGLVMICVYVIYIVVMGFNQTILGLCDRKSDTKVHDVKVLTKSKDGSSDEDKDEDSSDEESTGFFDIPDGIMDKILWLLSLPFKLIFFVTIPDCSKEHLAKFYLVSFAMCMAWLAGLCAVMVEFASEIGCLLNIHPVVMGVTFLAAGTSVPDAMASVIVARDGKADMAIANAVGSNVFDVLLGLGIPWFLVELTLSKRTYVDRDGVLIYVLILAGTLGLYVLSIAFNGWTMNRNLSYMYFTLYAGYIIFILATEI